METVYQHAWAAGMLDADGTITIKRQKVRDRWMYIPFIQLTQVDMFKGNANVKKLQSIFGGNVRVSSIKGGFTGKSTPVISWQATSKTAGEVIEKILPFTAGKSRQVGLLSEYVKRFYGKDGYHLVSEKENAEREVYFNKMRGFQEKGFSPTTTKRIGS